MKPRLIITLTVLLMLAGISVNAQNSNQYPNTSSIIGDLNGDNKVNAADIVDLVNYLKNMSLDDNTTSSERTIFVKEDINKDGFVNSADLEALVHLIIYEDFVKFAVANVSNDTEYADILFLCNNGSYVIYNGKFEEGYTAIHFNVLSKNAVDGITLIVDTNGYPLMASTPEGHFLFYNINKDKSDFTFISNQGDVSFYKDITNGFDIEATNETRGIKQAFANKFLGGWDAHSEKALKLYTIKLFIFGIVAVQAVTGGPVGWISAYNTFSNEINNSLERTDEYAFYENLASLELSELYSLLIKGKIDLSILLYLLNTYVEEELREMGTFQPYIAPRFDGEEWQITLDPDVLDFQSESSYDVVNVHSKAKWEIDSTEVKEWCEFKKYDEQIFIRVKDNNEYDDRKCNLFIYCPFTNDIFTKVLQVRQDGFKYKLSKKEVVLTASKRIETVIWNTTGVSSQKVVSCPDWCKVSWGSIIEVTITADESLYEEREGEIKISAIVEGRKIERTILVKQKPLCPDENHPHMIDLGLPSGTKWSCCNVGASSPEKVGNYYSWGNRTPLKYDNGSYYDYDYPFFEWKDLNNDGMVAPGYVETFIKFDEAYNSAVSGSWGNGSMPTNDDIDELDDVKMPKNKWREFHIGNTRGAIFTGDNGNSVFLPYTKDGYWAFSHSNKRAWICSFTRENGYVGFDSGPRDETTQGGKNNYIKGRQVRPVSK